MDEKIRPNVILRRLDSALTAKLVLTVLIITVISVLGSVGTVTAQQNNTAATATATLTLTVPPVNLPLIWGGFVSVLVVAVLCVPIAVLIYRVLFSVISLIMNRL
jgi:hypothetical protein